MVNGALDGVVTTLAVVAGATGASLQPRVALILGVANLVADGLSMAASNYLGLKSELQQAGIPPHVERPWRHGAATGLAFVTVGALPLMAYVVPRPPRVSLLAVSAVIAAGALLLAGALRGRFVGGRTWRSAVEMLAIGAAASGAAYAIGAAVERLTR